jgi:hypothetical protein
MLAKAQSDQIISSTPSTGTATIAGATRLAAILVITWLPFILGHNAVKSVVSLFQLASTTNPYFHPEYAGLLYIWSPIVVLSACIFLISPGLFLSLALNKGRGLGEFVVTGLALSIIVISVVTGFVQILMGEPLIGDKFTAIVIACSLACFGFSILRLARGKILYWPFNEPHNVTTLLSMVIVPAIILIALTPKFYWENFNGDGAQAFECARLLLKQPVPFWPPSAGDVSSFPGVSSMLFVYPASWFIRLFGEIEAAVRLPFLLDIVALYGSVLALIEYGRPKGPGRSERWLIWLGIAIYVIVVSYSATYNQYAADIALPATQDTLMMVFYLAFILAFLNQHRFWTFLFALLTYLSLPSGVQLIGFWLLGVVLIWKPRPWRQILEVIIAVLVCFLISGLAPFILKQFNLPPPGGEYALIDLLRHFAWLQWADGHRFLYLIVPCGILPAFSLLALHRQNRLGHTLTFVTVVYFFFFYFSAYISLHYFIPVMILPLVIFWQTDFLGQRVKRTMLFSAVLVTGIAALLISLPENFIPDTSARLVGSTMQDRIGGYDTLDPAAFKRTDLLYSLFPVDWDPRVPDESYGGSSLAWNYYMNRTSDSPREINYVIQRTSDPAPSGMELFAQEGDFSLYIRNKAVLAKQRALRPFSPAGSRIYQIPRGMMFRSVPLKNGPPIIEVVQVIEGMGFNLNPILYKLGVEQ